MLYTAETTLQDALPENAPTSQHYPNDSQCEAILVAKTVIKGEGDMKVEAKASLSRALQKDDFYVEGHKGDFFVANESGLPYARYPGQNKAVTRELEIARRGLVERDLLLEKQHDLIGYFEARVETLSQSLEFYKLGRQRFISVFKRDKLKSDTPADRRIIDAGNDVVHGGDAVTDTFIYTTMGGRMDPIVFKTLYGFFPQIVEKLSK